MYTLGNVQKKIYTISETDSKKIKVMNHVFCETSMYGFKLIIVSQVACFRHWWKKGLWSRFATAISRGCATATRRARLKAPPFSRGCLRTATKGPSTWAPGGRRGGGPLVAVLLANRD